VSTISPMVSDLVKSASASKRGPRQRPLSLVGPNLGDVKIAWLVEIPKSEVVHVGHLVSRERGRLAYIAILYKLDGMLCVDRSRNHPS